MRITPLGFCLRVIVNKKPLNLEKTTSSVLSVLLLIDGKSKQADVSKFKKEFEVGNLKVFTQDFLPLCRK